MTKVFIDKALLEQAINTLGYYASVCGEDDQDTPAKQAQTALRAAQAEPAVGPVAKAMTAHRAAYFMERFKKEEKLLGPNEQAAVDFVIDMLTATHTAPPPPAEPAADAAPAAVTGPIEAVAYLDIGTGGYLDLGTDLADEALSRLPKGRHALVIAGTYGIDGYIAAPTTQPAVEQAEKLDPLTQLQVAYVMGLRDANSAPQPAPVQEAVTWNQVQVCTWIGNQLMTQPSMFERNAVCKFVRSLGRNEKLAKYFPAPMAAQPRKAVNLTGEEVGMLTVFDGLHHVETPLLAEFIRAIEAALRQKAGL